MAEQSAGEAAASSTVAPQRRASRALAKMTGSGSKTDGEGKSGILPTAARAIRDEEGKTLTRLLASTMATTLGMALVRRAIRHPLVSLLGIGVIAAAVLAPDKEPSDEV